jgi:hypothetical protein
MSDWLNKNPKLAAGIAVGVLALAGLILFFVLRGSGDSGAAATTATAGTSAGGAGSTPGGTGYPGAAGGTGYPSMGPPGGAPGGYPGMGGMPSSMTASASGDTGGTGSSDPDALQKGKKPRSGRTNPMQPWWLTRIVIHPAPPPPPPPLFTPPTPPVYVASNPPRVEAVGEGGPNGQAGFGTLQAPQRMAGILYNPDRVLAVVEQAGATSGYVVQPGDMIGDSRVVAISPTTVTVQKNGKRTEVPFTPGSLNGIPPASALSSSYANSNPFGAGMPGYPGMGGGYPGMGGGYPGMGGGYPGMGGGYPGMGGGYPGMGGGYPGMGGGGYPGFGGSLGGPPL